MAEAKGKLYLEVDAQNAVDGLESIVGKAQSVVGKFKEIKATVDKAFEMMTAEAEMKRLERSVPLAVLKELRSATQGTVQDIQLLSFASKNLVGDFKLTHQQLTLVARAALQLHGEGRGPFQQIAQDLTTAFGKNAQEQLIKYGVEFKYTGDRVRDVTGLIEALHRRVANGEAFDKGIRNVEQMKVKWTQTWTDLQRALVPLVTIIVQELVPSLQAIGDSIASMMSLAGRFGQSDVFKVAKKYYGYFNYVNPIYQGYRLNKKFVDEISNQSGPSLFDATQTQLFQGGARAGWVTGGMDAGASAVAQGYQAGAAGFSSRALADAARLRQYALFAEGRDALAKNIRSAQSSELIDGVLGSVGTPLYGGLNYAQYRLRNRGTASRGARGDIQTPTIGERLWEGGASRFRGMWREMLERQAAEEAEGAAGVADYTRGLFGQIQGPAGGTIFDSLSGLGGFIGEGAAAERAESGTGYALGLFGGKAAEKLAKQRASMESALGDTTGPLGAAFSGLSSGIMAAVDAAISGSDSIGKAFAKAASAALKAIAVESTGRAIYHGALALGSLAFGDLKGAGLHAAAAAKFGLAAAGTGVLAAGLGSLGASGGQSAGAGAGQSVGGGFGGQASGGGPRTVIVNVNGFAGGGSGASRDLQKTIVGALEQADRAGTNKRTNVATFE